VVLQPLHRARLVDGEEIILDLLLVLVIFLIKVLLITKAVLIAIEAQD